MIDSSVGAIVDKRVGWEVGICGRFVGARDSAILGVVVGPLSGAIVGADRGVVVILFGVPVVLGIVGAFVAIDGESAGIVVAELGTFVDGTVTGVVETAIGILVWAGADGAPVADGTDRGASVVASGGSLLVGTAIGTAVEERVGNRVGRTNEGLTVGALVDGVGSWALLGDEVGAIAGDSVGTTMSHVSALVLENGLLAGSVDKSSSNTSTSGGSNAMQIRELTSS